MNKDYELERALHRRYEMKKIALKMLNSTNQEIRSLGLELIWASKSEPE